MSRELSIFLDLVRFLAALAVFVGHYSWQKHSGGLFWQLHGIGREAVDIFFVLSGFVIAHATAGREADWRAFAAARLARIASVALPALALTAALDAVGVRLRPEVYADDCCTSLAAYARNLVFAGNWWGFNVSPGSNVPYWSLGFEAWYYLAFGLALFLPRRGVLAAGLAMLAIGPGVAILFPLWLAGAWCRGRTAGAWALWLGLAGMAAALWFSERAGQIYEPFALTGARLGDYAHDYAMGLSFALVLLGFPAAGALVAPLRRLERPIRWFAGGTFALYLFHVPLLHFLAAALPWPVGSWPSRGALLLLTPALCLALAGVTERRKAGWRRWADGLLGAGRGARRAG